MTRPSQCEGFLFIFMNMKRAFIILGIATLLFALMSCASNKKHCDAYGNKSGSIDKNEQTV